MSNKNKTERMELPESKKTERMEIPDTPTPGSSSFTGSLKAGEVIKGYEVKSLISSSTGEAEIFSAQKKDFKAIIKYYHANFKPKEDIILKFHNIDHPDIITLYEYGTHNGRFYEIMEYAEGGTLDDKNPDGTYKYLPMSEDGVKQIIDETINAFLFLHKEGVIHRDIKPGNLFYKNADGTDLLIGDFGISSELDTERGMSKRMTSTLALSEGYAAPELYGIAKDDNKVKILIGPEVDYYALGITVYELLTAINPFAGRNPLHIMRDTIEGRVADDLLTRPEAKKMSSQYQKLIRGLLTLRHDKRWKYGEVSRWLKGEAVEVFKEVQQQKVPSLKFGEKTVSSIVEMAEVINTDRDLAKKYLMRGMFDQWAMKFDESLANDIIDIKEVEGDEESKISSLLFLLDPSLPCKLDDNIKVNTIPEFIELFRTKGELIGDVLFGGKTTDVYAWLAVHSPELGEELKKAVSTFNKSDNKSSDEILKNIHQIYISLAGERVKPFADSDLEVSSIEDLSNIPDNFHEEVLKHLENKNSILYLWLLSKDIPEGFEQDWELATKDWYNLEKILSGTVHKNREEKREKELERVQRKRRWVRVWGGISLVITFLFLYIFRNNPFVVIIGLMQIFLLFKLMVEKKVYENKYLAWALILGSISTMLYSTIFLIIFWICYRDYRNYYFQVNVLKPNVMAPPPPSGRVSDTTQNQSQTNFSFLSPYWQQEFTQIQQSNEMYQGKWNWPAFFFGIFWALSKGLVLSALICVITVFITFGLAAIFWVFYYPIRGNYMYYKKIAKNENPII